MIFETSFNDGEASGTVDAVKPGLPIFTYDAESGTLRRVTELPGYAGVLGGRKMVRRRYKPVRDF